MDSAVDDGSYKKTQLALDLWIIRSWLLYKSSYPFGNGKQTTFQKLEQEWQLQFLKKSKPAFLQKQRPRHQ